MEDNNDIDNLFRSALDGLREDPPERSWNSIQTNLAQKRLVRKRRRGLWFLSSAILLMLIGGTTFYYLHSHTTTEDDASLTHPRLVEDGNKQTDLTSTYNMDKADVESTSPANNNRAAIQSEIPGEAEKSVHENDSKNRIETEGNLSNNSNITESDKAEKAYQKNKPRFKTSVTVSTPEKKLQIVNADQTAQKSNPTVQTSDENLNPVQRKKSLESNYSIQAEAVNENTEPVPTATSIPEDVMKEKNSDGNEEVADKVNKSSVSGSNEGLSIYSAENTTEDVNADNKSDVIDDGNKLQNAEKENADSSSSSKIDESKSKQENNTNETSSTANDSANSFFKKFVSHLSFDVYYSPDYINSKLESNPNYLGTASTNPADYASEKSKFSYSTGFHIRYDIGKNWSIGSGISYSTFTQSAVYNSISVVSDSVYQKVHGHNRPSGGPGGGPGGGGGSHGGGHSSGHHGNNAHRPPGNDDHHFVIQTPCGAIDLYHQPQRPGGGPVQNGDTLNIKTETSEKTTYLYVPLTLRYQFGKGKLSYFLEAGGTLNLVHRNEVVILINDAYTENNEHDGLKNMNFSLLFGGGMQYNFYKGLNMFLRPTLRYSISPVNQNNPVNVYPYFIGVGAGFSIHF